MNDWESESSSFEREKRIISEELEQTIDKNRFDYFFNTDDKGLHLTFELVLPTANHLQETAEIHYLVVDLLNRLESLRLLATVVENLDGYGGVCILLQRSVPMVQ